MSAVEWEPGDPLNAWDPRPHRNVGLYNFRLDNESEECHCADSARWPVPTASLDLGDRDELGIFIAAVRRDQQVAS